MSSAQLARLVGVTPKECALLLTELEGAGIFSRTDADVIYSRRMVRDESLRERRANGGHAGAEHGVKGAEHGSKGGRPKNHKGGLETPLNVSKEPPPAIASASASALHRREVVADPPCDAPAEAEFAPTPAGQIGLAFRRAGVDSTTINLADPRLTELLRQGATPAEFEGLALEAISKGIDKPVPWIYATLQGRRAEASRIALAPRGSTETAYQRSMRERMEQATPTIAAKRPGAPTNPNPMEILDGITRIAG